MTTLNQEDLECFQCSLEDCKEKNRNCKRRIAIEERRFFKEKTRKHKMTSTYIRQEPIIVR